MKRLLYIAVCLMVVVQSWAGPVTEDEARQKASKFLNGRVAAHTRGSAPAANDLKMMEAGPEDSYFIFNVGNNDGYVVVSGEDATEEILGYSDTGSLDPKSIPCNMQMLFDIYASQIKYIREKGITREAIKRHRTRAGDENLPESFLIDENRRSKFDQDGPYNNQCPSYDDNENHHCVTGCVATAMAGLLYAYQWPNATTKLIPSYITKTTQHHVPEIANHTVIDWQNIKDSYSEWYVENGIKKYRETGGRNASQKAAIASLMVMAGTSVKMDYRKSSSSAHTSLDAAPALRDYFGFDDNTSYFARSSNEANWKTMLRNELYNNGPVIYRGTEPEKGGHAFLLEGWDGEFFYVNFGWSGDKNGNWLLEAVEGEENIISYTDNQGAVLNVKPRENDQIEVVNVFFYNGEKEDHVITGDHLSGVIRLRNLSTTNSTKDIILSLTDQQTDEKKKFIFTSPILPEKEYYLGFKFKDLTIGHSYVFTVQDFTDNEIYSLGTLFCQEEAAFDPNDVISGNEKLAQYEYWFDDDFNGRVPVDINSNSAVIKTSINTEKLEDGVHRLHFRLRRNDGAYSAINTTTFLKLTKEEKAELEYWIDDEEEHSTIPVEAIEEEQDLWLNLSKAPIGNHKLKMQLSLPGAVKGNVYTQNVLKLASGMADHLEYWFDDDIKNRSTLEGNPSEEGAIYTYNTNIDLSGLSLGFHRLNMRAISSNGVTKGSVMTYKVQKLPTGKATKLEYWFDDNMPDSPQKLDGTLSSDGKYYTFNKDISLAKLSMGLHRLNVRPASEGTTRGVPMTFNVLKLSSGKATKLECWFDDDKKNRQVLTGTLSDIGENEYVYNSNLNLEGLASGHHRLYYRTISENGLTSGAISSTPIIIKSGYPLADEDVKVMGYSIWADNETPLSYDVAKPRQTQVIEAEYDTRKLNAGEHTLYAKVWNNFGAGTTIQQNFTVTPLANPELTITATLTRSEVNIQCNSLPNDLNYSVYRKPKGGEYIKIHNKQSCFPSDIIYADRPAAGQYTYQVSGDYVDTDGKEHTVMSNEVEMNVHYLEPVFFGWISGTLRLNDRLLANGYTFVELELDDGTKQRCSVPFGSYGFGWIPLNAHAKLTVTGLFAGAFEPQEITVGRSNEVDFYGTDENAEPAEYASEFDLKLASTITWEDKAFKFKVQSLQPDRDWHGDVQVYAVEKDKADKKNNGQTDDISSVAGGKWLCSTEYITTKESNTCDVTIPLDAIGNLRKKKDFYFVFRTYGKYSTYKPSNKPLSMDSKFSETDGYVEHTLEKGNYSEEPKIIEDDMSMLANLLVRLSCKVNGLDGHVGDLSSFNSVVTQAAKSVGTVGTDDFEKLVAYMEKKSVWDLLNDNSLAPLCKTIDMGSSMISIYREKLLPYCKTAEGFTSALNVLKDLHRGVEGNSFYDKFFSCAHQLFYLSSKYATNGYLGAICTEFGTMFDVGDSFAQAAMQLGENYYALYEPNLWNENDTYGKYNAHIDFKIKIKKGWGHLDFSDSDLSQAIDYAKIHLTTNSSVKEYELSMKPVGVDDGIMLKQTDMYPNDPIDGGYHVERMWMEIKWANGRLSLIPLMKNNKFGVKYVPSTDNKPLGTYMYTVNFKTKSDELKHIADELEIND